MPIAPYHPEWGDCAHADIPDVAFYRCEIGIVKRGRKCTRCKKTIQPGYIFHETASVEDGHFNYSCICGPGHDHPLTCHENKEVCK